MVTAAVSILLLATAAEPGAEDAQVKAALSGGTYPWYDPKADSIRPIEPPWDLSSYLPNWSLPNLSFAAGVGYILVVLVFAAALAALIALLIWSIRNAGSPELSRVATRRVAGTASRVGALPPGLDLGVDDLWAEAIRRRSIGDLSGAILCLFVHQLLALEKRGLLRLAPGKTARQLVRSVGPTEFRSRVEPTLRLFEIAFYGHHAPESAPFEAAWAEAETLERLLAGEARP